jgi:hypothetical protein
MRIAAGILLFLFSAWSAVGQQQQQINSKLKAQLDSVGELDQRYRTLLMVSRDPVKKDSIAKSLGLTNTDLDTYFFTNITRTDSANLVFTERIIKQYGYPGKTLVGPKTNEVVWNVIQHSPKIPQYMALIREAGKQQELPFKLVAQMEDRYLMRQHKEQLYGTQACSGCLKSGANDLVVWPIKDPKQVNRRRQQAGFDQTIEQYAKEYFHIDYKALPLSHFK